jgi:hypothetical protein
MLIKPLFLITLLCVSNSVVPSYSQTTTPASGNTLSPKSDVQKAFEASMAVAVKLYPSTAVANSPLVLEIERLDKIAGLYGFEINKDRYKPLLLAIIAANGLGIDSDWSHLTDEDRSEVFHELLASLKGSETEFNAAFLSSIRGSSEAVPDVNAQMVKKQIEEIADLKQEIREHRNYIKGLYADDASAKDALGQAQYAAWQAWQTQQQPQQQTFHVEDSNGNSGQVIVTPQ